MAYDMRISDWSSDVCSSDLDRKDARRASPPIHCRTDAMAKRSCAAPAATPSPAADAALLPLDYMLQVLRDPEASPAERKWAAEKAAPYLHPRLQTVENSARTLPRHHRARNGTAPSW